MKQDIEPVNPKYEGMLQRIKSRIDQYLENKVAHLTFSHTTRSAIRKAVSVGGKRIRAIMSFLLSRELGLSNREALEIASSVELCHAFTLVHDDMIDRPTLRRGSPPLFSEFGEGIALLVGDMLLALSFSYSSYDSARLFSKFVQDVIEGQIQDVLWAEGKIERSEENLKKIQEMKTSSLFKLSLLLPFHVFLGRISPLGASIKRSEGAERSSKAAKVLFRNSSDLKEMRRKLELFAHHFGFAFQILDDIRDVDEDSSKGSPNILSFLGAEETLKLLCKHRKLTLSHLEDFISLMRRKTIFTELLKYLCIVTLDEKDIQHFVSYKGAE